MLQLWNIFCKLTVPHTFAYIIHCVAIAKCLSTDTLLPPQFSGTAWIITLETTICVKDLRNLKRSAYTAFKLSTSPYPTQWPKQRDRTALSFIITCYGFENTNQLMAYSIVFIDVDYLHLFISLSLSLSQPLLSSLTINLSFGMCFPFSYLSCILPSFYWIHIAFIAYGGIKSCVAIYHFSCQNCIRRYKFVN